MFEYLFTSKTGWEENENEIFMSSTWLWDVSKSDKKSAAREMNCKERKEMTD